jgi:parallel beta-helix repeat protein
LRDGSTGALLTLNNCAHLNLQGIAFGGNYLNCPSGTQCVSITGTESGNGLWIRECAFFSAKTDGLIIGGTYSKMQLLDNLAEACQGWGIAVFSGSGGEVRGNRTVVNIAGGIVIGCDDIRLVDNFSQGNTGPNYYIQNSDNSIISGNRSIIGSGNGMIIQDSNYVTVTGNSLDHTGTGIVCENVLFSTISSNTIYLTGISGITLKKNASNVESRYNTVLGNTIRNTVFCGIKIDDCAYNTLGINTVVDCGIGGAEPFGIVLTGVATNSTVVGNTSILSSTGFYTHANADDTHLVGNNFLPNTSAGSSINGTLTGDSTGNND